jgi:hypothetical protein
MASTKVTQHYQEILKAMLSNKLKIVAAVVVALGLIGSPGLLAYRGGVTQAEEPQKVETRTTTKDPQNKSPAVAEPKKIDPLVRLQLDSTQKEYLQVISDLRKAEVELKLMQSRLNRKVEAIPEADVLEIVANYPDVQSKRRIVESLEEYLSKIEAVRGDSEKPDTAVWKKLQEETNRARAELEHRSSIARKFAEDKVRKNITNELHVRIAQQSERVEFLQALKDVLKAEIDRLTDESKQDDSEDSRINRLEKEFRELRATIDELKKRK